MQFKNTKIIATIGPSSWDPKIMEELVKEGMDIARLNFSHGTFEEKETQIITSVESDDEYQNSLNLKA